jgi:hypothetical protein
MQLYARRRLATKQSMLVPRRAPPWSPECYQLSTGPPLRPYRLLLYLPGYAFYKDCWCQGLPQREQCVFDDLARRRCISTEQKCLLLDMSWVQAGKKSFWVLVGVSGKCR